jgi:hypothetical protein
VTRLKVPENWIVALLCLTAPPAVIGGGIVLREWPIPGKGELHYLFGSLAVLGFVLLLRFGGLFQFVSPEVVRRTEEALGQSDWLNIAGQSMAVRRIRLVQACTMAGAFGGIALLLMMLSGFQGLYRDWTGMEILTLVVGLASLVYFLGRGFRLIRELQKLPESK